MTEIRGLVFDKDGTLFDFRATWGGWSRRILEELAGGSTDLAATLGTAIGYDLSDGSFAPDSPVIAHTAPEIATYLLPHLPGADHAVLVARMNAMAAVTDLVAATPLVPLFEALTARGLRLGLATNDAEEPAHAHLRAADVARFFQFVSGFDSGHGAKPDPGPLLAFARSQGLDPESVAMVGDSRHDLVAGRAAGMRTVAVLTGVAEAEELAPLADVVLPDIGHLPRWIDTQVMAVT
ncbi:HAD family hydrolase [Defluviimonas salinarum]|uniref:phosphoglycolate phosphatase n=1 Tax=Defluviimonas salinarum TaxID=2992147 RepID=A0ABT3J275_9RHOB|nr:HAD family hydrolase [Defluviimonas salinarum]MCW3781797.1 HAD family hydrolase [Defluviimonas salinarum]